MDLERVTLLVFIALFNNEQYVEIDGKRHTIRYFRQKAIKYVDVPLEGISYRFVEQNPHKKSKWAKMARDGAKILWVFKADDYFARMVNGKFEHLDS